MKEQSTRLLVWLALSFPVIGMLEGYLPENIVNAGALGLPHGVLVLIWTFEWCKSHARENIKTSLSGYPIVCAVIPPVGIPVYFFRHFGLQQGGIKLLKFLGFAVIIEAGYLAPYSLIKWLTM